MLSEDTISKMIIECILKVDKRSEWIHTTSPSDGMGIYFFKRLVAKIKHRKTDNFRHIAIPTTFTSFFTVPSNMPYVKDWLRYAIVTKSDFENLSSCFQNLYQNLLENYRDAEMFGCCSCYEQCSDLKKCIKNDDVFSNRCYYKQNLKNGLIFYGKNRNI